MVRLIEAVGSSSRSWDAAVTDAVRSVADDAPDPIGVEVARLWADLDGRKRLRTYRASVKVAYRQPLQRPAGTAATKRTGGRRTR